MSKFIIEVRTKGFGRAEQELKKASGQTRKFARNANDASSAGAVFRKEVSQLRNNMLLYTFAIGGAVMGMGRFVMAASDAREQASKFRVVFGEFAPEADAFAQSITDSFGFAKSEMVGLLASLQDTFVPLGFSREQATDLSKSIAQLAMDVGSFNNLATGDVAKRFTSAIIGNHEAVRELGISLTEVSIKQEAQRLGLIDANEEMTQSAKILGRMSLIYNNTTDAQGDLIRTQDEFANRLRGVQGQFRQFTEDVGESLIPLAEFGLSMSSFILTGPRLEAVLTAATLALTTYSVTTVKAMLATDGLSAAMKRNLLFAAGAAFFIAIDAVMKKIENFGKSTVAVQYEVENLDDLVHKLAQGNLDLSGATEQSTKAIEEQRKAVERLVEQNQDRQNAVQARLAVMKEDTELGKAAARAYFAENRQLSELEVNTYKQIDALLAKRAAEREASKLKRDELQEELRLEREAIKLAKEQADAELAAGEKQMQLQDSLAKVQLESTRLQLEADGASEKQIERLSIFEGALQDIANTTGDGAGAFAQLAMHIDKNTESLSMADLNIQTADITQRKYIQGVMDNANAQVLLAENTNNTTKAMKNNANIAAAALNGLTGAIRVLKSEADDPKQQMKALVQTIGSIAAAVGGPSGVAAGAFLNLTSELILGHTGGLIHNNGIQRFATGGMVQGQDNVPIMAQAGEFIMQRSAVQNIGVQNLAEMNRSGSAGGVTVNIQGNMIGNDEFVRDNLIPQLQKVSSQDLA